ncbi:hypothetical protein LIER_37657 [Lithospermum erythrorhizon]|uniref:Uncharacterized protein n=1 Tax=Lithospermum erythrorhizon TaxID=34254 RepID=A0AAV3PNM7_LITER
MRVTPWNPYQLVDQETYPDIQLDSHKKYLVRKCASFVCFGRATAGLEKSSPLKVGPTQLQEVLPEGSPPHKEKDTTSPPDVVEQNGAKKKNTVKSSLRKPKDSIEVSWGSNEEHEVLIEEVNKVGSETERRKVKLQVPCGCDEEHEQSCEKGNEVSSQIKRMKVQWMDTAGGELVEIREFEPSDDGRSGDEFDNGNGKTCSCTMM